MAWPLIGAAASCGLVSVLLVLLWWRGRTVRIAESRAREARRELRQTLQVTRTPTDAQNLLQRHLEQILPGASATFLPPSGSCAALRLGTEYRRSVGSERLLACDRCGAATTPTTCVPAIAAGEPVGSLLVERPVGFDAQALELVREAAAYAAPTLAHLHNVAEAESRAATDALTGLPNSRALRDELKRMVAQAGRSLSPLSVILLDLDHFRRINDTFGHDRGDDVLAVIGEVLSAGIRASDCAGRYGGEEFLVLLPETDMDGAAVLAEKLRQTIARTTVDGIDGPLSASFGVASLPADGGDADALVRLAARALYAAKTSGRNRVETAGLSVAPAPDAG